MAVHEGSISAFHSLREASWGVSCPLRKRYMPEVGLSGVALWANVAFLPKVLPQTHFNQPVQLARIDIQENGTLELLCPVGALRAYIDSCRYTRQACTRQQLSVFIGLCPLPAGPGAPLAAPLSHQLTVVVCAGPSGPLIRLPGAFVPPVAGLLGGLVPQSLTGAPQELSPKSCPSSWPRTRSSQ